MITRSIHDMGYDPVRDEIVTISTRALAITTFKGNADGDVAPIRKIMGPKTQFSYGGGRLALDPMHHEIFVPSTRNKILVFPQTADGDVEPLRVLEGPDTLLGARALTVDPVHNLLIVSGGTHGWGGGDLSPADLFIKGSQGKRGSLEGGSFGQIAIFDRTASGNTKPLRVITGAGTLLSFDQTIMTTYPPRGWILGAVWGSDYGEIGAPHSEKAFVGVWSIYDNGDAAPRWTIGGPNGILRQARGVTLDPKHKTVLVSDKYLNGVLSFEFPEIF